jgi:D-alanine-D-alanine ligase
MSNKKLKIALIFGGPSPEYDVSLKTAEAMRTSLDPKNYEVVDVHITRKGEWNIDSKKLSLEQALQRLRMVDVALLAVHGSFGEDGELQKILSENDIIFTGSDANASRTAMDKVASSKLFVRAGLLAPETFVAKDLDQAKKVAKKLSFPFVVKPVNQGSSVGVSIVHSRNQLQNAVNRALKYDELIILQEYIDGREVSCSVIENSAKKTKALPPTELIPIRADFFDYEAKYTPGATNEITPPELPTDLINQIKVDALAAHKLVGCSGYSRTDMILRDDKIYVIEINTLPGMTETSMLPQQAAVEGMSLSELLNLIIRTTYKK